MGIKERHDRERSAVREGILHAARELFVTEGYRTVSMRKIAERIEYSPAAIYGYFASKDEIFYALAEEGFRMMREASRDAAVGIDDPLAALRSTFWSYYRFAKEQPQYFELMFLDRSVPEITDPERFTALIEMWQAVHERIERCVEAASFPPRSTSPPPSTFSGRRCTAPRRCISASASDLARARTCWRPTRSTSPSPACAPASRRRSWRRRVMTSPLRRPR